MKRILFSLLLIGLAWSPAQAETCLSQSSPPTFENGQAVPTVCDTHGTQKVMTVDEDGNYVAGGGASLAEQQTQTTHLATIANAAVRTLTIASGVTTNTTTTPIAGVAGSKTYWAKVDGTGAVTATVQFNGCHTAATTYCVVLGTITLTATTQDYDVTSPANGTADYPYLGITTTSVTGTGATVVAGVNY